MVLRPVVYSAADMYLEGSLSAQRSAGWFVIRGSGPDAGSVEMAPSGFFLETLMAKPLNLLTAKYTRNSLPERHWRHTG